MIRGCNLWGDATYYGVERVNVHGHREEDLHWWNEHEEQEVSNHENENHNPDFT